MPTLRTYGLAVCVGAIAACNSLTGLDDVKYADDGPSEPSFRPVDGVTITAVTLYQGIRRPLMEEGLSVTSQVPVVAGRQALLRVFYEVDAANFNSELVTVRLTIDEGDPIELEKTLKTGASSEGALSSTVNFDIPGELLLTTSAYKVELLQPREQASGDNESASYPSGEELAPFKAKNVGSSMKLVLVPIEYNADGTGRLPVTSEQQLKLYRDFFYKIYPAPKVEVTLLDPFPWSGSVSNFGGGWGELLDAITDFRQTNGAAPDEYYYGIFRPADDYSQYCNGGCIAGLSSLAGPTDEYSRAGIGVGFSGPGSVETGIHEVGHQHGRQHAPCGNPSSVDGQYPHPEGAIGEWGYDLIEGTMVQPTTADFMSYCDPTWVSDYTFISLIERIKVVNGADIHNPLAQTGPQVYERITVGLDGAAQWRKPVNLRFPPAAQAVTVTLETAVAGDQQVTAHYYRYSHLTGGYLLFPKTTLGGAGAANFMVDGVSHRVLR